MKYPCDICGRYLYLDPGEPRICDDCQAQIVRNKRLRRRTADNYTLVDCQQMNMEEIIYEH